MVGALKLSLRAPLEAVEQLQRSDIMLELLVPGSVGLQARVFVGPGSSVVALPFLTACCRAAVVGNFKVGLTCESCRAVFYGPKPALQLRRGDLLEAWQLSDHSQAELTDLLEHDLPPLHSDLQRARVEALLLRVYNRMDRTVWPMLADRRARLASRVEVEILTSLLVELREEFEWLA